MKKNNQKGVSLLLTIFVMAALLVIALGVSRLSLGETRIARLSSQTLSAFYAAEAGMELALYLDRRGDPLPLGVTHYLDSNNQISYVIVSASGESPSRVIQVKGNYRNTSRALELTY